MEQAKVVQCDGESSNRNNHPLTGHQVTPAMNYYFIFTVIIRINNTK